MNPLLRIGYVFQSSVELHQHGGLQTHIYHVVKGLQRVGHRVTFVALRPGRKVLCTEAIDRARAGNLRDCDYARMKLSGAPIFRRFESGVRRLQSVLHLPYLALFDSRRIYEACCEKLRDCDLFHERYNIMALGGTLTSCKTGVPLVLEVNGDMLDEMDYLGDPQRGLSRTYAEWATRFTFRIARRIICVSTQLKEHLIEEWHIRPEVIAVLPNAADVITFAPRTDGAAVRQQLGLTDEPVVVFVGGFYPWHDLPLLVESFRRVLAQVPRARLLLVGSGRTLPVVQARIAELGLEGSIVVTGNVEHTQVPAILSGADVAVVPAPPDRHSLWASPLKLFEYMAAGKAIVATLTGQLAEVIRDGETGLLVAPGDAMAFADAVVRLLKDPVLRDRLGQNARKQAVEEHSWERYVDRLADVYGSALEEHRSGRR